MNVFTVLEIAAVLLLIAFFATQIIVPIFRDRPFFPMFSRQADLLKKRAQAKQRQDEEGLKKQLNKAK